MGMINLGKVKVVEVPTTSGNVLTKLVCDDHGISFTIPQDPLEWYKNQLGEIHLILESVPKNDMRLNTVECDCCHDSFLYHEGWTCDDCGVTFCTEDCLLSHSCADSEYLKD